MVNRLLFKVFKNEFIKFSTVSWNTRFRKKHGTEITIAKLLYTTLAANSVIPTNQLGDKVAKTLPQLAKVGSVKINEWAKKYNWNE